MSLTLTLTLRISFLRIKLQKHHPLPKCFHCHKNPSVVLMQIHRVAAPAIPPPSAFSTCVAASVGQFHLSPGLDTERSHPATCPHPHHPPKSGHPPQSECDILPAPPSRTAGASQRLLATPRTLTEL